MRLTTTHIRFLNRLLLYCGMALAMSSGANAQQKKADLPPHFSDHAAAKYHEMSLTQIVGAIDQAFGLNILIDGTSLKPTADIEFDGTLEDALNKVAETFDYTWKVGKGSIVMFNKRFRIRDEGPQANLLEITRLVRNITDIFGLANVGPDPTQWTNQVRMLGQSLSDQQWTKLQNDKRIEARDLTPEQFQVMRSAVLNNTFGNPMKDWAEFAERLRNIKTAYLIAHRLPGDPAHPEAATAYTYEIVWRTRDGSLASEDILIHFFGND